MRSFSKRSVAVLAACAALSAWMTPLGAAEIFKARMLTGRAPVEPPMINVQIEVTGWTTPEEILRLNDTLAQSGVEGFLAAFGAMDKGVVRFMNARGFNLPIHAAQSLPTDKGKRILIVLNRQSWEPNSRRIVGRHYFMVIELKLNEKGKGEGRFYEDAQIQLDPGLGKIEMETYESAPKLLPQVQEIIKKDAEKK